MLAPRTLVALASVALASTAVMLPSAARSQYLVPLRDCSGSTISSTLLEICMEGNRLANDLNRISLARERQACINMIDQARALAARGDGRGWNRVPTRCLY